MKLKGSICFSVLVLVLFMSLVSCDNGGMVAKSNVRAYVTLYPSILSSTGTATYNVSVQLKDLTASDDGDFSYSVVNVNGQSFTGDNDPNYCFESSFISLSIGDPVTVTVTHPSFGSFTVDGVVPTPVSDFTISPGVPVGVNSVSSYDLSWTAVNYANSYLPMVYGYEDANALNYIRGLGYHVYGTTHTATTAEDDGTVYPYFLIRLYSMDNNAISGLDSSSLLSVRSPNAPEKGNTN